MKQQSAAHLGNEAKVAGEDFRPVRQQRVIDIEDHSVPVRELRVSNKQNRERRLTWGQARREQRNALATSAPGSTARRCIDLALQSENPRMKNTS